VPGAASRPLEGRRALVTGGSRGIGAAIVARLAAAGAAVTWNGRAADEARAPQGGTAVAADLTRAADRRRLVERAAGDAGLDILVNNAGIFAAGGIETLDLASARRLFELDFWVPLELARLALPSLRARRGTIVNLSSVNAVLAQPGALAYCAAKAALEMATRCLASELAPAGIRVNAVAPGPVPTRLLDDALEGRDPAVLEPYVPLGRLGAPADVAEAVAWLASDASAWVTGQVLRVDGGMSA